MNRRDLLRAATALGLTSVAGRVWAAPKADARLLVVFLRGAYDAANVVIPTGSAFYYQARPNLAVARPDPGNPNAALALDADWGSTRRCATRSCRSTPRARRPSCLSPAPTT
jgi:uncharacterized protein (DUF1501 family)